MISRVKLLYIEPALAAPSEPLVDALTRRMTGAFRAAHPRNARYRGVHECACGAHSTNRDYLLPGGETTNSLCVHYLARHRSEVPDAQLARVAALPAGECAPTADELAGARWELLRAADSYGGELYLALAQAGLDLTPAFLRAEARHAFAPLVAFARMPVAAVPALVAAIRGEHSNPTEWLIAVAGSADWRKRWARLLQSVVDAAAQRTAVRAWATRALAIYRRAKASGAPKRRPRGSARAAR